MNTPTAEEIAHFDKLAEEHEAAYRAQFTDESWAEYEAWQEESFKEAQEVERTGLHICPKCNTRALKATPQRTLNYGGGWDTYYKCQNCDYKDIAV